MAPVPNSTLALKRQQLIEDNQKLELQGETLQNDISQAQETLASLQSNIDVIRQELSDSRLEKEVLISDVSQLKTEKEKLKNEIGVSDDADVYPEGSLNYEKQKLKNAIKKLETDGQKREEEIDAKTKELDVAYQKHKAKIEKNITIIDNVKKFKEESVQNMRFYGRCMVLAIFLVLVVGWFSLHNISETLQLFSEQLKVINVGLVPNGWNWVYAALSIVIVKIPNALLFAGLLFVLYKIFGVLFGVYEKINTEKRKISTIEALVHHMNEQSVGIVLGREIDYENKDEIENAKDDLKWNILSEYFSQTAEDSADSDNVLRRENKVLREIFLNKHKRYSFNGPMVGAEMETGNPTKSL